MQKKRMPRGRAGRGRIERAPRLFLRKRPSARAQFPAVRAVFAALKTR